MPIMESTGQWEIVGKQKKVKGHNQSLTKSQKKQLIDKMPRIETRDPVKEDRTIYDAFNTADTAQENKKNRQGHNTQAANGGVKKGTHSQIKKKRPEQNGKHIVKEMTLDAAIAQIDHKELESILSQSQIRFPENQDVWLKDLASYLNLKLEKVVETDPTYKKKDKNYPMVQLSSSCRKVIMEVFKKCSKSSLDHLFYHCVQAIIAESSKGFSTAGYKVFLQALAHYKPTIVISKLPQYLELIKTHQTRPANCLAILWALGQCGVTNLRCGVRVWLSLMFPCLEIKAVAFYPVEYLENLFRWHTNISEAFEELTLREYFTVLDAFFSPTLNIQGDLRKRLQTIYPKLKMLAYGGNPASHLRDFFASYLSRADPKAPVAMKHELLSCLVLCLMMDKHCWSTWCRMYTKHLPQSGVLLHYLADNLDRIGSSDRHMLRLTLRSFAVTNEELAASGQTAVEGFQTCNMATQELLQKLNKSHFPWGLLAFFFVSIFCGVVAYDIISSPSIRASKTVRFIEDYGLLSVLELAWQRVTTFLSLVLNWVEDNFPRYYNWAVVTAGPSIKQAWLTAVEFVTYIINAARPHCLWAMEKTHHALLWVYELSPSRWEQCRVWLWLSWEYLKDYTHWIWKHAVHLIWVSQHWLQEHVFTCCFSTKIQQSAVWSFHQLQDYTVSLFSWCNQLLFSTNK